ncbi:uncharacterized protein ARMOST_21383 [Armillaria ostoyae]|uniref:Nephrocystin 3-like N-terminal domain-containing protein n=1 Tax=Armillaria ostoyae TaxID=47428 RepID=A0A284S9Y5_ARMOS|nr:uncharacterized protein ARMOST_21383 [Armillaria ostoyae]
MADQKHLFRYLQKVEIHDFQTLARNASHLYVEVVVGSTSRKSPTYKVNSQSVIVWSLMPDWIDLSTSTVVEFKLYRPSRVSPMPAKLLGCSKKHVSDVVGNDCTTFYLSSTSGAQDTCSVKIICSDDLRGPSPTIGTLSESTEPMTLMVAKVGEMGLATQAVDRKRYIQKLEVSDLQTSIRNRTGIYMKVIGRNVDHKTPVFQMSPESTPSWSISIDLDDFEGSSLVKFEIHAHGKTLVRRKPLGRVELPRSDLLSSTETATSLINSESPAVTVCSIRIFCSGDSREVAGELVKAITKPDEHANAILTVLDSLEPLKVVIDMLAEVHPAAKIAFNIVSIGYNVLKKRKDENQLVLDLYSTMLSAYRDASEDEILQRRDRLYPVYECLFEQTIECSYFIEGYAKKGIIGKILTSNLSVKAQDFQQGFERLREKLQSGIVKETLIVTLGTRQLVDELTMRELLRDLRPPTELRPKSTCMKGTRIETISYLMSWIATCSGDMLWCSGLAGTGKSSLVGTLHELLTVHASRRNRLGAFIRYDRLEYSNASHFITSMAYLLGMYDTRIGTAISSVIRRNRAVLSLGASSASEQFRLLLREPLESLPDLADEGPLVVIIDGLDESDATKEVLSVLSRGFGPNLPFMRLLVFSRPVEVISRAFAAPNSAVTRFALDTASREVDSDIRHFIQSEFTTIHNDPLTCDEAFEKTCREMNVIDRLARRASGLFIWAATVCRFIAECPSISRLEALLTSDVPNDATDSLTTLYKTTLDTILSESKLPGSDEDLIKCILDVLGALMVARIPPGMTPEALNIVLSPKDPNPRVILAKLGSVLQRNEEDGGFIRLIHKSFDDFLTNPLRCKERWFIDIEAYRRKFARQCLLSLTDFLVSWMPDSDIPIPPHIRDYALVGPLWHIQCFGVQDFEDLRVLFEDQLSKWLQVASIARKGDDILREITEVLYWVDEVVTDMNCRFRLLTYHAFQHAELEFRPLFRAWKDPDGPQDAPPMRLGSTNAEVRWHKHKPYSSAYYDWSCIYRVSNPCEHTPR